jgi:hypothetical protein
VRDGSMEGYVSIDFPSGPRVHCPSKSRSAGSRSRKARRRSRPYTSWRLYFHRRVKRVLGRPRETWGCLSDKPPCIGKWTITLHRFRRFVRPYIPQIARIMLVIFLFLDARSMFQRGDSRLYRSDEGKNLAMHLSTTERRPHLLDSVFSMIGIVSGICFAAHQFEMQAFFGVVTYMLHQCIRSAMWSTSSARSCVQSLACITSVWLMKQIKRRRRIQFSELDGTFVYAPNQWTFFGFTEADIANLSVRISSSVLLLGEACFPAPGRRRLYLAVVFPFAMGLAMGQYARRNAFVCIFLFAYSLTVREGVATRNLGTEHALCIIAALALIVHSGPRAMSVDEIRRPSIDRQTDWDDPNLKLAL